MLKARIVMDRWYRVYTVETDDEGQVDIPEELEARANAAHLEFSEVQLLLEELYYEARNTTTQSD